MSKKRNSEVIISSNEDSMDSTDEISSGTEFVVVRKKKKQVLKSSKTSIKEKSSAFHQPRYACDECNLHFEYGYALTRHKITHSLLKVRISCGMKNCRYTEYFFKTKQIYFRHMERHGITTNTGTIEYLYKMQDGTYHPLLTYDFDRMNAEPIEEQRAFEHAYQIMLNTFPSTNHLEEKRNSIKREVAKTRPDAQFKVNLYTNSIQRGEFTHRIPFFIKRIFQKQVFFYIFL